MPSSLVGITNDANGDFVIKGTGFLPNEALTVQMSRYNGSPCVSCDGTACAWGHQADANGDYLRVTPLDAITTAGPHLYWIVGAHGEGTNHVVVMLPRGSSLPDGPKPADQTVIIIVGSSPGLFHIHSVGYLPNEPLTIRLGADVAPNCQANGASCIWRAAADSNGDYDALCDFSSVNGFGKYWISITGDTSGRSGLTSFMLGHPAQR